MPIEVHPFADAFADGVLALILPIQREEFDIPITAAAQPDLAAIPAFYQCGAGNFWVAVADGQVVGTLGLKDIGDATVALRKMFVAAPFRGREHGVAARLLAAAIEWCRTNGVRRIYLGTTEKFLAAHRFYEKHGFVTVERTALPTAFPVMAVDTRFYALALDTP